jgi:transglutaminase-like putative cysteine protease
LSRFHPFDDCLLRSLGFAARYVSGYLETLPPKGKVKLQGSDALWVSVYVPEMGWCDLII